MSPRLWTVSLLLLSSWAIAESRPDAGLAHGQHRVQGELRCPQSAPDLELCPVFKFAMPSLDTAEQVGRGRVLIGARHCVGPALFSSRM